MPADRHKRQPVSIRFEDGDRLWLLEESQRTGRPVQRVIIDAVREARARSETTVTCRKRKGD